MLGLLKIDPAESVFVMVRQRFRFQSDLIFLWFNTTETWSSDYYVSAEGKGVSESLRWFCGEEARRNFLCNSDEVKGGGEKIGGVKLRVSYFILFLKSIKVDKIVLFETEIDISF